jgi:uncharacterized protein (TIGR00369 family)
VSAAIASALDFAARSPEETRTRTITWQDPLGAAAAGAGLAGIEHMRALASGDLPPPPIAVLLRIAPVEVAEGRVSFEGEPGEEHYNPIGTVHGGYAATLLDSVLGCAVHTTLEAGESYTTAGLEVKFLRPITREVERVRAVGEVDYRGRRQATAQARLTDASGQRLLASATTTCLILS